MTASQYQSLVTVVVDGVPWGVFETRTGGATSGEVTKYRPGGMQKQRIRKGQSDTDDVTVTRSWERERDADLFRAARPRVNRASVIVNDQPLDDEGAPSGKPTTYTGILQSISDGDSDSNSSEAKTLTLVTTVTEVA